MGKYSNIIVGYDGSDSSKNALMQALKIAKAAEGGRVKAVSVLYSTDVEVELMGAWGYREHMKEPVEKLLAAAVEAANKEGVKITTSIEQGYASDRIAHVADAENSDLIVMGRRGLGRLERMMMGSVTARVIGHTKKDVLVVPKDSSIGWRYVILATDGSRYSDAALERAIDYAKSYGASIRAVSVVDMRSDYYTEVPDAANQITAHAREVLDNAKKRAEESGVRIDTFLKEGTIYSSICDFAGEYRADVIIMGSHGRRGLSKLLMGSVTEKVIGHACCPVLVVKP